MSPQCAAQLEPEMLPAGRRPRLLIIEDDTSLAEMLAIALERQGYQVSIAAEGGYGLELARRLCPDLVLLDLQLPDMDGFDVAQQLDDDEQTAEIPVIILSGLQQHDIIRRCRATGSSYFVRKPYDPNVLLVLIQKVLGQSDESADERSA